MSLGSVQVTGPCPYQDKIEFPRFFLLSASFDERFKLQASPSPHIHLSFHSEALWPLAAPLTCKNLGYFGYTSRRNYGGLLDICGKSYYFSFDMLIFDLISFRSKTIFEIHKTTPIIILMKSGLSRLTGSRQHKFKNTSSIQRLLLPCGRKPVAPMADPSYLPYTHVGHLCCILVFTSFSSFLYFFKCGRFLSCILTHFFPQIYLVISSFFMAPVMTYLCAHSFQMCILTLELQERTPIIRMCFVCFTLHSTCWKPLGTFIYKLSSHSHFLLLVNCLRNTVATWNLSVKFHLGPSLTPNLILSFPFLLTCLLSSFSLPTRSSYLYYLLSGS